MSLLTSPDFLHAAKEGDLDFIQDYHQHGGDLHLNQDEALRWSAGNGHLDIVQYLIQNGADVHADCDCALQWSAESGHLDVVQYLLQNGADVHADKDYALRWSAVNGHLPVVQILIEHGANIHKGISGAQYQPLVLTWLEDYQRMQHEQSILHQEVTEPVHHSLTAKRL